MSIYPTTFFRNPEKYQAFYEKKPLCQQIPAAFVYFGDKTDSGRKNNSNITFHYSQL